MVFALWHELDAVSRQGPEDLVPDVMADVAMAFAFGRSPRGEATLGSGIGGDVFEGI